MWGVSTMVTVPPGTTSEDLRRALEDVAVPAVRALPDLRHATWTVTDDHTTGEGFYLFETEAAARARAASYVIGAPAPGGVTIAKVTVLEVLVHIDVTG